MMGKTSYYYRLREHLTQYKEQVLGVTDQGTWTYRGRSIPYRHILPPSKRRLNILDGFRREFWTYWDHQRLADHPPASLHPQFAHLTSSQALAFNVFFPFLGSTHARADLILQALGIQPAPVKSWRFEAVLDPAEETNFDAALTFASGERLLIEVKLAETTFGGCPDDERHQSKLRDIYKPRLANVVSKEALESGAFFARYQILRNISYVDPQTTIVFLVPRANEALAESVSFISVAVQEPHRPKVLVRFLEDVVGGLAPLTKGTVLEEYVGALSAKYILPTDTTSG